MKNTVQLSGEVITVTPNVAVPSGGGYQVGSFFGLATNDVAANTAGEFTTEGVFTLPKTSALAIAFGDRLFWDATNKVVNKTVTAQLCIGVAVSDAANPSATVSVKLGDYLPSGT